MIAQTNRSKAIDYRIAYPDMDMTEIARHINVSRERVRQILQETGLPTITLKHNYKCIKCGKSICIGNKSGMCRGCYISEHWVEHWLLLHCEVCGSKFTRAKCKDNQARRRSYQHIFCSKQCQGEWLGSNYGRGHKKEGE